MGVLIGVVAGALAIAVLFFALRRRHAAMKNRADPRAPHHGGVVNLEHEREDDQQRDASNPTTIVVIGGNEVSGPSSQQNVSPPGYASVDQRSILPPAYQSAAVSANADVESFKPAQLLSTAPLYNTLQFGTTEKITHSGKGGGGGVVEGSTNRVSSMVTNSTTTVSTVDQTELEEIRFSARTGVAPLHDDLIPVSGESGASSTFGSRRVSSGLGYGQAVMAAAQELAHHCNIPGISEAASMVSILINLVSDSRDGMNRRDARGRGCRSLVMVLKRAAQVLGEVSVVPRVHTSWVLWFGPCMISSRLWCGDKSGMRRPSKRVKYFFLHRIILMQHHRNDNGVTFVLTLLLLFSCLVLCLLEAPTLSLVRFIACHGKGGMNLSPRRAPRDQGCKMCKILTECTHQHL